MHLLIDVRTSNPSDALNIRYAEIWARIWLNRFPHYRITFLAYEGDPIHRNDTIFISRKGFLHRKNIVHHNNGPKRIVSFSPLPSIDRNIPTIAHISDISPLLYPRGEVGFFSQYLLRKRYKKLIKESRYVIVPHESIKEEIIDFFGIMNQHIHTIPILIDEIGDDTISQVGGQKEYMILEGTPGDEWSPREILIEYSRYIHELGGTRLLIIIGDIGDNLGYLSSLIRSFNLIPYVKYLGTPHEAERNTLYKNASLFISIGVYPSRIYALSSALGYRIPTLLSDKTLYKEYASHSLPFHQLYKLGEILKVLEKDIGKSISSIKNESIIDAYRKIITD